MNRNGGTSLGATIEHLFISPGHNFFGHYGQPPGEHPLLEVDTVECIAGRGIQGDRFFDYRPDYKGQITFFDMEVLDQLRRELSRPDVHPGAMRRNALVRGLDLLSQVGREFELQGVRFAGVEECRPCDWMNRAIGPGAEDWLRGRAGLRCRILTDGVLRTGSAWTQTRCEDGSADQGRLALEDRSRQPSAR